MSERWLEELQEHVATCWEWHSPALQIGFRYTTREDWGRLRRLFTSALAFKLGGGLLATLALLALAPAADGILHKSGLRTPLLVGALLPLVQCTENVGGVAIILRGRYDIRLAAR